MGLLVISMLTQMFSGILELRAALQWLLAYNHGMDILTRSVCAFNIDREISPNAYGGMDNSKAAPAAQVQTITPFSR